MDKLISVVIPVYNVEKYLPQCLDSVTGQSYSNLQIILVDDGSTDSSGKICDEYALRDERIVVIHQQNAGAGAAKNAGLELVKGEYLSIVDSDDFIDREMYSVLAESMEKYGGDVVQCTHRNCYVNGEDSVEYKAASPRVETMKTEDFLKEYLYFWQYAVFWNKLFKASLLGEIRFPTARKIDDEFFTYKLICGGKQVVVINRPFYNYRMRKSSVMNQNKELVLAKDRVSCFLERYAYVTERFPNLTGLYYDRLADLLLYYKNTYGAEDFIESAIAKFPVKSGVLTKVKERLRFSKYKAAPPPSRSGKEYYD